MSFYTLLYILIATFNVGLATTWRFVCDGTTITGVLMPSGDVSPGMFSQFKGNLCKEDPGTVNQYWVCTDCIQKCPDRLELLSSHSLIISKDKVPNNLKVGWFQTNIIANVGGTCTLTDQGSDNGEGSTEALKSFSKTSVLFVSISFIILMVISLAWLVFYYVQRFRYAHAKDRLQRRLFNAARKALARIPTRPLRSGDDELSTDCPVCLDPYLTHDIVRTLPCKHLYHKSCIDPWLLEHRTCPMCKADILKYFGYQYYDTNCMRPDDVMSRVELGDGERPIRTGTPEVMSSSSESNAFNIDGSDADTSYPFSNNFAPQLVLNASNARTFIPMTSRVNSADSRRDDHSQSPDQSARSTVPSTFTQQIVQRTVEPAYQSRKRVPNPSATTSNPSSSTSSSNTQSSQGQIVNLVQVQTRVATTTRAATLRKESVVNKLTPVETTLTSSTGTNIV